MLTIKKYSKSCLPGGVYPIVPLIPIELLSFELPNNVFIWQHRKYVTEKG